MDKMKDGILQQPQTMERVLEGAPHQMEKMAEALGDSRISRIYLVGSGTSLNAAYAAKYAFIRWCDAEVQVFTPFEFLNYFPTDRLDEESLVLGISQTARSTGTIDCIKMARECGARTVFVTAEPDAPGAQCADTILDTCTGPELCGAKTKGFTSTIAMLYIFAAALGGEALDLTDISELMQETINRTEKMIPGLVEDFVNAKSITVIGGGALTSAAKEGGLKILECIRVPVEVYDVEEYMHGPYHCLEKDSYLVFLVNDAPGRDRSLRMIDFARKHSDHVLVIGAESLNKDIIKFEGALNFRFLELPDCDDELKTALYYPIPLQWLANDVTEAKGRVPGQSRYPDFHKELGSKFMPKENYYKG